MSITFNQEQRGPSALAPAPGEIASCGPGHVDTFSASVLSLGLTMAVLLPAAMSSWGFGSPQHGFSVVIITTFWSTVAILAGLLFISSVLTFPLVRTVTWVFVGLASSFGAVDLMLTAARVAFSSQQFISSFVASAVATEVFLMVRRRRNVLTFGIAPNCRSEITIPDWVSRIRLVKLDGVPNRADIFSGIVVDIRNAMDPAWERYMAETALAGRPVFHIKQFNEMMTGRVAVDHLSENTIGAFLGHLSYPRIKVVLDMLATLLIMPVLLPAILVLCIAVKLDSPGPAFFYQQRIGKGGRPFTVFKLRTMRQRSEAAGPDFTQAADNRITRLGAFLRKYRFDELPQAFNILRAEMSWIGPRPEALSLAEWYDAEVPFYSYRHIVRPGITGWAQVNQGNVASPDAARLKLEYDFYYIKNFSFWLDVIIVVKTLRTILTGFGSR
jgi:lipopolysaccharide/colanic/teichoic acid biosynthesis glycosyltransferase